MSEEDLTEGQMDVLMTFAVIYVLIFTGILLLAVYNVFSFMLKIKSMASRLLMWLFYISVILQSVVLVYQNVLFIFRHDHLVEKALQCGKGQFEVKGTLFNTSDEVLELTNSALIMVIILTAYELSMNLELIDQSVVQLERKSDVNKRKLICSMIFATSVLMVFGVTEIMTDNFYNGKEDYHRLQLTCEYIMYFVFYTAVVCRLKRRMNNFNVQFLTEEMREVNIHQWLFGLSLLTVTLGKIAEIVIATLIPPSNCSQIVYWIQLIRYPTNLVYMAVPPGYMMLKQIKNFQARINRQNSGSILTAYQNDNKRDGTMLQGMEVLSSSAESNSSSSVDGSFMQNFPRSHTMMTIHTNIANLPRASENDMLVEIQTPSTQKRSDLLNSSDKYSALKMSIIATKLENNLFGKGISASIQLNRNNQRTQSTFVSPRISPRLLSAPLKKEDVKKYTATDPSLQQMSFETSMARLSSTVKDDTCSAKISGMKIFDPYDNSLNSIDYTDKSTNSQGSWLTND